VAPLKIMIRPGAQILNLQLKVASVAQQVTVEDRAVTVTPEPSNNASATVLAGDDLQALSDSPDLRLSKDFVLDASKKEKSPKITTAIDDFNVINQVNYSGYIGNLSSPLTRKTNGFTFQPVKEISMSLVKWTPITIKPPAESPRLQAPEHPYLSRTCTGYFSRFRTLVPKKRPFVFTRQ